MSALLQRIPLRAGYVLAVLCGRAAFAFSPRLRRTTMRNFRVVLHGAPVSELRRTARGSIENYCRYLVDFARFDGSPSGLAAPPEPFKMLRCATANRGAIIVPMHFGNWDTGAAAAVRQGFDLSVVGDRFSDARLDARVFGVRERLGMRVIPVDRPGPAMFRPLRGSGLLALLIDKPTPGTGVTVPFFGRCVEVPAGPARLALRTGAALVPVAFPRRSAWSPDVETLADFSIDSTPTGDLEADTLRLTAAVMRAHEAFIRRYPDQWYMFREMWLPPGGTG